MNDPVKLQREYYRRTAADYDEAHALETEHVKALDILSDAIRANGWRSALEVGCGTGRVARQLLMATPDVDWTGIDPSEQLLARIDPPLADRCAVGDGNRLPFPDRSFDVVYAFAVLHHVPRPARVIDEMLRVARKAVFISDGNNFGQGRPAVRRLKRALRAIGLWPLADWLNTRGKGYHYSDGDGVFYSFSPFSHMPRLRQWSCTVNVVGLNGEADPYRDAGSVAALALRREGRD